MNGLRRGKTAEGTLLQLFNCTHTNCGATFNRQWRLTEHETVHTGAVRKRFNMCLKVFRNHTSPKNVHSARVSAQSKDVVVVSHGNLT